MAPKCESIDVLVVGGGPAGSCVALKLARLGYRTMLVERERFPRRHVGESLAPSISLPLEQLGLLDRFLELAVPVHVSRIRWEDETAVRYAKNTDGRHQGYVVDRGLFDKMLLDAAELAGVNVCQPAKVEHRINPAMTAQSAIVVRRSDRSYIELKPRFLIDASGHRSFLSGGIRRYAPPTLGIFGYWHWERNFEFSVGETRIEAAPWGWAWGTRLPSGLHATALFADLDLKTHHCTSRHRLLSQILRQRLEGLALFEWTSRHELDGPARAIECGSRCASSLVGPNWIRVGEAAFSLDPLSSQGVQAALRSGLQAAATVHTLLQKPDRTAIATQFYVDRTQETVSFNQTAAESLYKRPERFQADPFWHRRSASAARINVSPTRIESTVPHWTSDLRIKLADSMAWDHTVVTDGEYITHKPALLSPHMDRAVAFVGGIPVEELLAPLSMSQSSAKGLYQHWESKFGAPRSQQLWTVVWKNRFLSVM